jgi:hypothetical protein
VLNGAKQHEKNNNCGGQAVVPNQVIEVHLCYTSTFFALGFFLSQVKCLPPSFFSQVASTCSGKKPRGVNGLTKQAAMFLSTTPTMPRSLRHGFGNT